VIERGVCSLSFARRWYSDGRNISECTAASLPFLRSGGTAREIRPLIVVGTPSTE